MVVSYKLRTNDFNWLLIEL
jgi:methionine--tRNA ligase beta chain